MEIPFRKLLGFSQETYSGYLQVSKGLISLVELDLRQLNWKAGKKQYDLWLRWIDFEKTWIPTAPEPPPEKEVEDARLFLTDELFRLKNVRDKIKINRKASRAFVPDYPKVNPFLKQELDRTTDRGEQLHLDALLYMNNLKAKGKPLLETIQQSMGDRLLDLQISEMEKSLSELDAG